MKSSTITVLVLSVSVLTGVALAEQPWQGFELPQQQVEDKEGLEYGSAHNHALFYIVINGTEKDLTADRFQLNSKYVHLENNKSDIVHKHAKGVTWKKFLNTLNMSISNPGKGRLCLDIAGNRTCGKGGAMLNGGNVFDPEFEIEQGDNFVIVLKDENWKATARKYLEKELPTPYKPYSSRGKQV